MTPSPAALAGAASRYRGAVERTQGLVKLESGALALDDTTLDKPYARKM